MTPASPLVLIEQYAHHTGGHHSHALAALAAARPGGVVIPHQATLVARCLTETACLRTARYLTGGRAGAVVRWRGAHPMGRIGA
ncbi:MAG TPA: hypothetical protein VN327_01185 [Pseudonocardiaceae bacterium]|nr:hypothetical protein [Pseudonocardiaceae bacterium]